MTREFVYTPTFEKQWKALGFTLRDTIRLEWEILNDPEVGKMMEGTGGLRKMRFALPAKGKSGGVRVCYVDFTEKGKVYFITCFAKKEQANLSDAEKNNIKKALQELKKHI